MRCSILQENDHWLLAAPSRFTNIGSNFRQTSARLYASPHTRRNRNLTVAFAPADFSPRWRRPREGMPPIESDIRKAALHLQAGSKTARPARSPDPKKPPQISQKVRRAFSASGSRKTDQWPDAPGESRQIGTD